MDESARDFEDAMFAIFNSITDPEIKAVDRSAIDLNAEVNRFKREKRHANKKADALLAQSLVRDANGEPSVTEFYGEKMENYWVDTTRSFFILIEQLKSNAPLPQDIEQLLGITLDYSPINAWSMRHIKWQAAAQVLWFNNPQANLEMIKTKLLKDSPIAINLFELLDFHILSSVDNVESRFRNLEDIIKKIDPRERKRGRRPKNEQNSSNVVPIPEDYNPCSHQINGQALYIAIDTIAKVLCLHRLNLEEILAHPVILKYEELSPFLFGIVFSRWVSDAICHL